MLDKIDSTKEIDQFKRNTIDNAPDLPESMGTYDTNSQILNNQNNNEMYSNNNNSNNNNGHFIAAERRLSDASRQLNSHRRSLEFEEKNYFELEAQRKRGICSYLCCCCCGSSSSSSASGSYSSSNSNSNNNGNKAKPKRYNYRKDTQKTFQDARNVESQGLLRNNGYGNVRTASNSAGSYQSPVLPPKPQNNNNNNNVEMSSSSVNNGYGTGVRGTYDSRQQQIKPKRGESVLSNNTTASNRQFDKV